MVQLPLTLEARIKLGYILVQLTGTMEDIQTWQDVGKAIELSDEEKKDIDLKESRDGDDALTGVKWNPKAPALGDNVMVEIETDHAKRLLTMLTSFQQFRGTDREWAQTTIKALKALV